MDPKQLRLEIVTAVMRAHVPEHVKEVERLLASAGSKASIPACEVVVKVCDRAVPFDSVPASVRHIRRVLNQPADAVGPTILATIVALDEEKALTTLRRPALAYAQVLLHADANHPWDQPVYYRTLLRELTHALRPYEEQLGGRWAETLKGLAPGWDGSTPDLALAALKLTRSA
jgi:hypothetical protein